jgi:hypothetical protein
MDYEPIVKRFFEKLDYQVEKIPETNEESPDFWISDDTSSYVLELKTKFPSEVEMEGRKRLLVSGEIHNINELIIRKNRLSNIIKKAKNQLKNYREEDILRIVWLLATGHLVEPRMLQFKATLYGSAYLVSNKRTGDCFYFYNSDFFRYREVLDAAIISTELKCELLLNPLSPRYAQMKSSSLTKYLSEYVVDPIQLEKDGKAFLVDNDVNRDDKGSILRYLREKYESDDIIDIKMNYLSGTIAIPEITK